MEEQAELLQTQPDLERQWSTRLEEVFRQKRAGRLTIRRAAFTLRLAVARMLGILDADVFAATECAPSKRLFGDRRSNKG